MSKFKYINANGQDAFPSIFDEAFWFDAYGYAGVREGKRAFYIKTDGSFALETNHKLTSFDKDGLGLVHKIDGRITTYGMLTICGEWFLPLHFRHLGYKKCGIFCCRFKGENLCLDHSGQKLFSLGEYWFGESMAFHFDRLLVRRAGNFYYMNTAGQVVHGPYWSAAPYYDGVACVKLTENASALFVDVNGKIIISSDGFEHVSEFWGNGVAEFQLNSKFGLLNRAGEFVVQPMYEQIESLWNDCYVGTNGRQHYIFDSRGSILLEVDSQIECIKYGVENVVAYRKGSKWGYLNLPDGDLITDAIYYEAGIMRHGRAPVAYVQ